jgi:hypothetical protein
MSTPEHVANAETKKGGLGKKIALGCLGVVLLLSLAGGIIVYRFVIVPGRSMLQSAEALQQLETLNEDIRNQQPFTAPASLSAEHVNRFVVVQRQLLEQLEGRMGELEARYEQTNQTDMNMSDIINVWQDFADVLVEAKRTQVNALNASGFSLAEYAWVRQQVFTAFGYSNITELPGVQENINPDEPSAEAVELVRPHQALLEQTLVLSAFGL